MDIRVTVDNSEVESTMAYLMEVLQLPEHQITTEPDGETMTWIDWGIPF